MNLPLIFFANAGNNPFEQVSKPVVDLLDMALTPALGIVGAWEQSTVFFLERNWQRRRSLRTGRRPRTV